MSYRGLTLQAFINQLLSVSGEMTNLRNPRIWTNSERTKARNQLLVEWYIQQPHDLQQMIYEACMDVADKVENIGAIGALELIMMLVIKDEKTISTR